MTVGAKPLTKGDRAAAAGPPTIAAADVRVLLNALERVGYDPAALARAVGVDRSLLEDPDARMPCESYGALIEAAQRTGRTPNLALRLAMVVPFGAYPLLDYLVATSDNVGTGMKQLAKYFQLTSNPMRLAIDDDADPHRVVMREPAVPFAVEYTVVLAIRHLHEETGGRFRAEHVTLSHRPDDPLEFERVLQCPVQLGGNWSGFSVSRETWQLPLRRRDPVLRQVLEQQANPIVEPLLPAAAPSAKVRHALAARVAAEDLRIEAIARELGMSARTLQRRLADEGVPYQQLVDEWRQHVARHHLSGTALAISEIAYLVGYSEPAPFHRAFKRWFGVTPQEFRRGESPRPA
jgi:AraC-like DNA-binding protein